MSLRRYSDVCAAPHGILDGYNEVNEDRRIRFTVNEPLSVTHDTLAVEYGDNGC